MTRMNQWTRLVAVIAVLGTCLLIVMHQAGTLRSTPPQQSCGDALQQQDELEWNATGEHLTSEDRNVFRTLIPQCQKTP